MSEVRESQKTITWLESKVTQRSWGDEILFAQTDGYTGKVLKRYGDEQHHRAGLQYHPDRDEAAYLLSGEAIFYSVDDAGVLRKRLLRPGDAVFIPSGAIHSFATVGDSVVFEVSTPGTMAAVRVEQDYDISAAVES